jgi:hypothetical protein
MIPHKYADPSDNPGQYAADHLPAPRQAVTVEWYWKHCLGQPVWAYDEEADKMGLDPWRILDDKIDKAVGGLAYWLGNKEVKPTHPVYVQKAKFPGRGPIPSPLGKNALISMVYDEIRKYMTKEEANYAARRIVEICKPEARN